MYLHGPFHPGYSNTDMFEVVCVGTTNYNHSMVIDTEYFHIDGHTNRYVN